jgi:hypothetical protein
VFTTGKNPGLYCGLYIRRYGFVIAIGGGQQNQCDDLKIDFE